MGEPGQQLRLDDGDVPDDRRRAIEDIGQRAESSGRIALGEADHRAGIADLNRKWLPEPGRRQQPAKPAAVLRDVVVRVGVRLRG